MISLTTLPDAAIEDVMVWANEAVNREANAVNKAEEACNLGLVGIHNRRLNRFITTRQALRVAIDVAMSA